MFYGIKNYAVCRFVECNRSTQAKINLFRAEKQRAMNFKAEKGEELKAGRHPVWNINVGIFDPGFIRSRILPEESKYWKIQIVLN